MRAPHLVVAALALAASSVAAEEPRASSPVAAEEPRASPPTPDPALSSVDPYGRLLATPDRKLLQLRGVQLSLRAAGGDATTAEPFAPPAPAPHEDRVYLSNMDARKTSLLFHLVPARAGGGVPR
jgi:hypothetical protein